MNYQYSIFDHIVLLMPVTVSRSVAPEVVQFRKYFKTGNNNQTHSLITPTQWYAIYMPNYAKYAGILSEALRTLQESNVKDPVKSPQRRKMVWTRQMKRAFSQIKHGMSEEVILHIADVNKKFVIRVDASDYALGAVLEQYDSGNKLRLVAFYSC